MGRGELCRNRRLVLKRRLGQRKRELLPRRARGLLMCRRRRELLY